ncbi:nucleoporin SEH1 [Biomphalaria pfeifferi]|uniref:Nucleoporin SEH1 n=1 Tax=Biomphalaria pfeifferi TaxID=112525 RepID=A0AAD8FEU4_BIOPF|nr:nucleoporin SEH1 [Biomphalaria pfeifferi]
MYNSITVLFRILSCLKTSLFLQDKYWCHFYIMFVAKSISSEHKDIIHDVSFDYHGTRMATCSSDHTVKVWDLEKGEWHCTASWKTHSGSVWRVTWAHPDFGQVLATCSFDRTAAVWEELSGDIGTKGGSSSNTWIKRTSLVDSRTSVTDVGFAPKHLGLQLATCSEDGIVRIYEAVDVMNLSNWQLQYEFNCNFKLSCLSWNTSRMHPPMIAVGSDEPSPAAGGKVQIYEYSETNRKWQKVEIIYTVTDPVHDVRFAPNMGRSYHLLAIASNDLVILTLKNLRKEGGNAGGPSRFEIRQTGSFDDHQSVVWRVSWNITGTILASSGDDGAVRLWKANYLDSWKCIAVLQSETYASDIEKTAFLAPSIASTPTPGSYR